MIKRLCVFFSFVAILLFEVMNTSAMAELVIDVTGANFKPMDIALPVFSSSSENAKVVANDIVEVISADLERSGLFNIMDKQSFLQHFSSVNEKPKFNDWQVIGALALLQGEVSEQQNGLLKVSFRLWDTFAKEQMTGKAMTTTVDNWRRIAHIIADTIYTRITGEKGYFDSRIVFISESGERNNRVKRLAIMDQDGANIKHLTSGKDMVLTPRFSPNMQQITYLSYHNNKPRVYIFDLQTGEQKILGDFPGMTFAPRFSPDGSSVIMSMAINGNSEIYKMDIKTKKVVRLTNHPSIDTSPSYSPDGEKIAFNSDRSGSQQIYVMDKDGKNVKRLTFNEGKYATPVYSPRGDYIAFTKIEGGMFYIGVMLEDGSNERLLAQGFLVEGPTWSPNGRVLSFFRQDMANGPVNIYTIDLTGYNERKIPTNGEASDPAWSPLNN